MHYNLAHQHLDLCCVMLQDITPKGRIINRFARDMSAADMAVGRTMVNALQSTMQLCFDVLAVAIATKGTAVALLIPLSLV